MSEYLGREILKIEDTVFEDVSVPEWGGVVRVRSLSGAERDAYEVSIIRTKGTDISFNMENMRARLISMSVIDENGKRVFSDRDVAKLGNKNGAALDRVHDVCQRISGLETGDNKKALENLALTPNGASTSN